MTTVFLNGDFLPAEKATISVMDRGFLFADSVYEVIPVDHGKPQFLAQHLERLQQSLTLILLNNFQINQSDWGNICERLIIDNQFSTTDAVIYIQISRGKQETREFNIPKAIKPTLFATIQPREQLSLSKLQQGYRAITLKDVRPLTTHIKTTALMPTILLQAHVDQANVDQAILIRDGFVTEGIASNLFIVKAGQIITPKLDEKILAGVTRQTLLKHCAKLNIPTTERPIKTAELFSADEVWLTSSSKPIFPLIEIDGKTIADGKPGIIWQQLIKWFLNVSG